MALPAAADLAAYRIIQEALTDVTRHAPGATVTIRIGYRADAVLVEIADTVRPNPAGVVAYDAARVGDGTGIAGMRERATALGGGLEAGHPLPRPAPGPRWGRAWSSGSRPSLLSRRRSDPGGRTADPR